ncbi:tail terminator [Gordonia phage Neville]|uniref:Tail terminator n=2 Tax=Nevillevirus TaxID=3044773 RepID=A0A515MGX6_9CAUD|nr:tail terminator [Gordonia phage Neville]YP_010246005.1 tail terminator [Gordonia phage Trax]AXQ64392.1 tail terminator [Gordonia phage Neville]QDM55907.1 tail terminator [Gordonia phage Trax]
MPFTFPDWYEGGYEDAEKAVRAMLVPFLKLVDPKPYWCAYLPDEYSESLPIVSSYRTGGSADPVKKFMDDAHIEVWAITERRSDSWDLLEYCRQMLLSYARGGIVTDPDSGRIFNISSVSEVVGPELTQMTVPDERAVSATFVVTTRKEAGLPDYARIRRQLQA